MGSAVIAAVPAKEEFRTQSATEEILSSSDKSFVPIATVLFARLYLY